MEKKEVLKNAGMYKDEKLLDIPGILNISIDLLRDIPKFIAVLSKISVEKSLKGIKDAALDQALSFSYKIAVNPALREEYISAYLGELRLDDFFTPKHQIINFFKSFHIPENFTKEQLDSAIQRMEAINKQDYARVLATIDERRKELENDNTIEKETKQSIIKELYQKLEQAQKKYHLNQQFLNTGYSILTDSLRKKGYQDILKNCQVLNTIMTKEQKSGENSLKTNQSSTMADEKNELSKPKIQLYQEEKNASIEVQPFLTVSSFQKQILILTNEQLCQLYRQMRNEKTKIEENVVPNLISINHAIKEVEDESMKEHFLDIKKILLYQNRSALENNSTYQKVLLNLEMMEKEFDKRHIRIVTKKKKGKSIEVSKDSLLKQDRELSKTQKIESNSFDSHNNDIIPSNIVPIEAKKEELKRKRFGLLKFKKAVQFTPIWQTSSYLKQLECLNDEQLFQLQAQMLQKKIEIEEKLIPNLDAINHAIDEVKLKTTLFLSPRIQEYKNNYKLLNVIRDSLFSQNQDRLKNSSIYKETIKQLELIEKEIDKRSKKVNGQTKKAL